ncbi:MAG: zf-HC2 domain-containing protein [Candidatus Aminicenantes bacterium]|nr:zf-HC2 domain-containing protein [Candidatus Aminicenantes bacterium]
MKKRLSDDFDGALTPAKKARLEVHLRGCPGCRAYRAGLVRLQSGAARAADRSPEYWSGFEERLGSKLAGIEPGRRTVCVPFSARRRWAWAAAGFLAVAAAGTYFVVGRAAGNVETAWVPYEDSLAPLLQAAEANPELGSLVNREILASIEELTLVPEKDLAVPPAEDPLFWEGLSEDELRYIASELERETGRGGPK